MRRIFYLVIPFLIFAGPLFAGDVPGGGAAPESVTMSWGKFMQIWDKYREPEIERSKPYAYESAYYDGRAVVERNKYYLKFEATIRIISFSADKMLVPVISVGLSPEEMLINNEPTGYIKRQGYYYVIIQEKGLHTVRSSFTITLDAQRWPRNFELPLVPIPKSEIKLNVTDSDIDARFEPGVVIETVRDNHGQKGDEIRGLVPAVESVGIRWLKRGEKREVIPLKMGAVVHSYVSLAENGANIKSNIGFQILQGETHYFQIRVPNTIDILDVTAIDGEEKISQWYAQDTESGRMVHIYASYKHKTKFSVRLDCERTETRTNYRFFVPHIVPLSVERYENLIAVGSEANVEITESSIERAEGRDVRFVPEEIRMFGKGRSLFYYKVLDEDFNLTFEVKSHEKASVVKTRVERVEADSVVTEGGTVMTKVTYRVKNNQAQFLKLHLPEGSKLLSAFTNGREIQPVMDNDTLLIPLDKSTDASFPVEIAWLSKIGQFGITGKGTVLLPFSPVSIGEMAWRLYTPEKFQMFYFSGNVDLKSSGIISSLNHLLLSMSNEHTRHAYAGGNSSKSYKYSAENVRKRFKKGRKLYEDSFDRGLGSSQIQVQIPVTGNVYRFSSYLIKGFTPEITFFYMNDAIHQVVGFGYGVCALIVTVCVLGIFFSRSELSRYVPEKRYWVIGLIIAAVLVAVLTVLKLGIFAQVLEGIGFAIIFFAFWHSRLEGKKYQFRVSGWRSHIPAVFLGLLGVTVAFALLIGESGAAVFVSILSIIFHALFFRLLKFIDGRLKKRKEALNVPAIIFSMMILCPALVWADAPGHNPPVGNRQISKEQQAGVRLSWPTVEHMLLNIEERENRLLKTPKTGYLFGTVQIDGDITEKYASLRIDVPLSLVKEEYIKIPLVSTTTPIAKAFYEGQPLALLRGDRYTYFEAGKETAREGLLQIHLAAPVREQGGVKEFTVSSPLLQGGAVELRFGTDIKSVKLYNVAWEKREGRVIRAALGTSQQLRGELATFIRKQEAAEEADKRVKKRYATTYTLVSLEDEIATYYSSIRYRILNEHVREFAVQLPKHAIVHEIVGEDMEGWRVDETEQGMNTYYIKVMYPVADRYDLSVRFETPILEDKKSFVIPCLLVEEVARDTGYIGIEMLGRGEISIDRLEKARLIDIRELPAIIRTDARAPFVYAFRYIERPYSISFNIRKHKGLQLDPAIADRIDYTRVVSPQGTVLSQAKIWVRNSRKQYVTFHLPQGSRIISSFLDGKSVKPSVNDKGTLLLPLKRQSVSPFILDVVFEDADVSVKRAGGAIHLSYPRVDIPVSAVSSNIYLPRRMKVFKPKGNFQKTTLIDYVKWTSHESTNNDNVLVQQTDVGNITAENQTMGTMSLKINIPKYGKKISLNAFYVPAGESLETSLYMIHQYLFYTGYVLAFISFIIVGGVIKKFYHRPLFWIISLLSLVLLYYLVVPSWKVILSGILIGIALLYLAEWLKMKRTLKAA